MKKALIGLLVLGGVIIAIAALMRLRSGSDDDLQIFVDDAPMKASSDVVGDVDTTTDAVS